MGCRKKVHAQVEFLELRKVHGPHKTKECMTNQQTTAAALDPCILALAGAPSCIACRPAAMLLCCQFWEATHLQLRVPQLHATLKAWALKEGILGQKTARHPGRQALARQAGTGVRASALAQNGHFLPP